MKEKKDKKQEVGQNAKIDDKALDKVQGGKCGILNIPEGIPTSKAPEAGSFKMNGKAFN